VTLAGISIYRGTMLQITGGYEVNPLPPAYRVLVDGRIAGIPKVLWLALGVLALNWLVLSRTLFGRRLLAVGNSEKASRLIGLSPWRLRAAAFAALGACVGLASVMWGGYYGKIQSNTGAGWELLVIAATVIGGCSITGGRGTALGAFLGSVLIALVYNSLVILRISSYWQNLFVGFLILGAVMTDIWLPAVAEARRRRAEA
jgi:ribose transport system permease protein